MASRRDDHKIFGDDLHAMRVLSLANSVTGTVDAAVLSIHAIGRGYARVTNNDEKHGVKQTDRMLGNKGIEVWDLFRPWAQFVVGERKEIVLALDWTEFDADDHATLAGYLITSHGRATPLIWMTVNKSTLKNKRNDHEYRLLERLHECLAADVKIARSSPTEASGIRSCTDSCKRSDGTSSFDFAVRSKSRTLKARGSRRMRGFRRMAARRSSAAHA